MTAYHGTMSDEGFIYCDRDGAVITFCIYDRTYREVSGEGGFPFNLTKAQKVAVEKRLISCPCGDKFSFDNHLKCPVCGGVLSRPMTRTHAEEAVIIGWHIDANQTWIWTHKPYPGPEVD